MSAVSEGAFHETVIEVAVCDVLTRFVGGSMACASAAGTATKTASRASASTPARGSRGHLKDFLPPPEFQGAKTRYAASQAAMQHYLRLRQTICGPAQRRMYTPKMSYPVNAGDFTTQTHKNQHIPTPIPKNPGGAPVAGGGGSRQTKRAPRENPERPGSNCRRQPVRPMLPGRRSRHGFCWRSRASNWRTRASAATRASRSRSARVSAVSARARWSS